MCKQLNLSNVYFFVFRMILDFDFDNPRLIKYR